MTEEYYLYGWKVLVLIDMHTRLPLAMKVVKIQAYEGRWLIPLLEQAQRNVGARGHIKTIVIDRGYLDGADLWQVHQMGVIFVVVSKSNMSVTQNAQALAKRERAVVRERVARHGHGKTAREEPLRTELVGIEGLTTYDSYGKPEQTQQAHRHDYESQPINAVVVRRWDNRPPASDGTTALLLGGRYKIFQIPLDLSAQTVLRGKVLLRLREELGHIHYFTKDTALQTLKDTGYQIVDYAYTSSSIELPSHVLTTNLLKMAKKAVFRSPFPKNRNSLPGLFKLLAFAQKTIIVVSIAMNTNFSPITNYFCY
jgi:Transposase DDE domain